MQRFVILVYLPQASYDLYLGVVFEPTVRFKSFQGLSQSVALNFNGLGHCDRLGVNFEVSQLRETRILELVHGAFVVVYVDEVLFRVGVFTEVAVQLNPFKSRDAVPVHIQYFVFLYREFGVLLGHSALLVIYVLRCLGPAFREGLPRAQQICSFQQLPLVLAVMGLELPENLLPVPERRVHVLVDAGEPNEVALAHIAQIFKGVGTLDVVLNDPTQHSYTVSRHETYPNPPRCRCPGVWPVPCRRAHSAIARW